MAMTRYLVKFGGSPDDSGEICDDLGGAEDLCLHMAEQYAERQGIPVDDVELYNNEGINGPERGACPDGESGDYWPVIKEIQ